MPNADDTTSPSPDEVPEVPPAVVRGPWAALPHGDTHGDMASRGHGDARVAVPTPPGLNHADQGTHLDAHWDALPLHADWRAHPHADAHGDAAPVPHGDIIRTHVVFPAPMRHLDTHTDSPHVPHADAHADSVGPPHVGGHADAVGPPHADAHTDAPASPVIPPVAPRQDADNGRAATALRDDEQTGE